jgi:heparin binding hemagglutinin HbhA
VTESITHQKENTMAKARFDIPTQLPTGVTRPLYAGIGVTDRVVEVVREAVADVQKRAEAVQKDVQKTVSGKDAQARRQAVEQRVVSLQADAQELPARLQKLVDDQIATVGVTLDELVKRGETLVGRIRRQPSTTATTASATTTPAKAKTTRTQASKTAKTAKKSTTRTTKKAAKSPARSSAKATSTSARKTAASAARATGDAATKVGD